MPETSVHVRDKNREISPLERERGRLRGKGSGETVSFKTRMEDPVRHANHRFRSSRSLAMEESTLRWPTDKERKEMEEVCSIGEVPHTKKSV